jgi:protein-tyrosine-phosphatase
MAEALARRIVEARGWDGVRIGSAGVAAVGGAGASAPAVEAAAEDGLDLTNHRSRLLDADGVDEADLILAMSPSHLPRIAELGGRDRMALLAEVAEPGSADGVPDPFGGDLETYRRTFRTLERLVERALDTLEDRVTP